MKLIKIRHLSGLNNEINKNKKIVINHDKFFKKVIKKMRKQSFKKIISFKMKFPL